jgi:2'-5' RNA ligase
MKPSRLFVAIDPAPGVRAHIEDALARVRPIAPSARWVGAASLHVTLAFLGDTPDERIPELEAAIAAAVGPHDPFDLCFRGAGVFGGRCPHVLWAGVAGDATAVASLQRDVAAAVTSLGWVLEDRPYSPHVTLARSRERRGDLRLAACEAALAGEDFGVTRVDAAVLYRSDLTPAGPRYVRLAVLPLSA